MNLYENKPSEKNVEKIYEKLFKNNSLIEHIICGKSHCDRNINAFRIGNNSKESLLLAGAFHGSEWLCALILIKIFDDILKSLKIKDKMNIFLNNYNLCIIPIVNPDGVEIAINSYKGACKYENLVRNLTLDTSTWQANARGVDINHNFDAGWEELHKLEQESGINSPASTRYGGTHPESENETKAITNFCLNNKINMALAFHSQGEEIYWDYDSFTPPSSIKIGSLLARESGYKLSKPEGLAIGGGFKDWFIKRISKPAFTIEIGKGKNPLPLSDLDKIYPNIKNMIFSLIDFLNN